MPERSTRSDNRRAMPFSSLMADYGITCSMRRSGKIRWNPEALSGFAARLAHELMALRTRLELRNIRSARECMRGKGSKRRAVPIRQELAQMLRLHIGTRRRSAVPAGLPASAPTHHGNEAAVAGHGHHRCAAFSWSREYHDDTPLCGNDRGDPAAEIRPGHGSGRSSPSASSFCHIQVSGPALSSGGQLPLPPM